MTVNKIYNLQSRAPKKTCLLVLQLYLVRTTGKVKYEIENTVEGHCNKSIMAKKCSLTVPIIKQ